MQTRVALVQGCEDLEEFYVLLETKFSTDSSKTSDNICAVDWGTIPGILRGFHIIEKSGFSPRWEKINSDYHNYPLKGLNF